MTAWPALQAPGAAPGCAAQKLYKLKQEQGGRVSRYSPSSSRSRHLPATGKSWPICPHPQDPLSRRRPCSAQPLSAAWSLRTQPPLHLGPQRGGPEEPEAEGATPVEGEGDGRRKQEEDLIQQSLDDHDASTALGCSRRMSCHWMPTCQSRDEDLQRLQLSRQQLQAQVQWGGAEVGLPCLWGGQGQSFLAGEGGCP